MPSYNHSKFIGKALKSVLDQSYQNWEAIIIDNQSTDETDKILGMFNDTRFKYFKINNNGIIAKSRNLGIKLAKGEWIAFLDSDDWWTSDKLEVCLKNNNNDDVDFIYHDLVVEYDKPKFNLHKKSLKGRKLNKPILKDLLVGGISAGNAIGNSSAIVRKKILNQIGGISENKDLVASEDYNTWLRIAQITDKFKYINQKLGYYLIHNLSSQKRDLSIPHRHAIIEFMGLLNDQQKLNFEVKLKYMSGNYNTLENNFNKAKKDFMFVFKNGDINFKVRSLLKLFLIMFK
tara:strand:+ start:81 stop:947 length:867 start_codon:yes stop_codon:yes gene_type:complete